MRYIGSMLSDNLSAKEHLKKRRTAAFTALARISKLGFSDVQTDTAIKRNLFKAFTRTTALYGIIFQSYLSR